MAFETITVGELIELLQDCDENDKVVFASNYGDRYRTQQAHRITGSLERVTLTESAYSDSGYAVADDEDGEIGNGTSDDGACYLQLK